MGKKNGKISPPLCKEAENIKLELGLVNYQNSKKSGTDDMNSDIDSLVDKIHALDEKINKYLVWTDPKYSSVPEYCDLKERIKKTREGSGVNGLNCQNLEEYYDKYKEGKYREGKYNAFQFMCDVEKLFGEINRECGELFEWFVHGHIERKEVSYEGLESVFDI